jgi:hypothetical protein
MINEQAYYASLPLAESLDGKNIYLTALDGTPLAALVQANRTGQTALTTTSADGSYTPDISQITYMANVRNETQGPSPHDQAMDDVAQVCIGAVQNALAQARIIVRPVVKDLAERVTAAMATVSASSLLGMEVFVKNTPAIFESAQLVSAVSKVKDVPYDPPELRMRLPDITVEDMVKLMATGSGSMDTEIKQWVGEQGDSFFIWLWEKAFQQKDYESNGTPTVTFRSLVEDSDHGPSNALGIYLITRRLIDEDPLEGTEMDARTYDRLLVEFRDQAALALSYHFETMKRQDESGILVLGVEGKKTTVNGRLYRKWIEEGGENEVLFGNIIDNSISTDVQTLNDRALELKQVWARHEGLTQTVETNRRFDRIKALLADEFGKQLNEMSDEERANATVPRIVLCFNDELARVTSTDVADLTCLYKTCMRLVCRSRFYYTDAEAILSGLDEAAEQNPGIDVRQAGLISTALYTARWLASQVRANTI